MNTLKVYEKPSITTLDSAAILDQIGPAQAASSGTQSPDPYNEVTRTAGGNGSRTHFGQ
jgi:hypothetical protein